MSKYRNIRKDAEDLATDEMEQEEKLLAEPSKTVEDEMWKKRYGDQQRYLNQVKGELKTKTEELERKLDAALRGQLKAPKSDTEVEAWIKEYPEFAGILETIVQKRITEATSKTKEKLEEIETKGRAVEAEKAILSLKKLHPDLDKLTNSEAFHAWLQNQSQRYQTAIYGSLDVDEADFVISKYKAQKRGPKSSQGDTEDFNANDAAKVVRQSATVDEPSSDGDYEFSESQIERESKKNSRWFDKNEEAIMKAMREGKILMDLSGGAR
jgi:replicative superfamily II helicase